MKRYTPSSLFFATILLPGALFGGCKKESKNNAVVAPQMATTYDSVKKMSGGRLWDGSF